MSTQKTTNREISFDDVMERAKLIAGVSTWRDLADVLGISSGDLANRKKRRALPHDRLIDLVNSREASMDWLLTGEGSMYRSAPMAPMPILTTREEAVLAMFRALDEDAQREIQQVAEEKKRLRDVEQQIKELQALLPHGKRSA
jgi:hypothetical protein